MDAIILDKTVNEPLLDIFIFETSRQIEQLELLIIGSEKYRSYTEDSINEIFRIMHTIKGSSAMMLFDNISALSHTIEDLFYFLREERPEDIAYEVLSDLVLEGADFIKVELDKLKSGQMADGDAATISRKIKDFLQVLKENGDTSQKGAAGGSNAFKICLHFEDGCDMENIRAYSVVHTLKDAAKELYHIPENIVSDDECIEVIRKEGFTVFIKTDLTYDQLEGLLMQTIFLKDLLIIKMDDNQELEKPLQRKSILLGNNEADITVPGDEAVFSNTGHQQSLISVNVNKLDRLMDLIGEMVIAEAMVTQSPDIRGLELHGFQKAARQLNKITNELQDIVMAIRMIPISATLHKMQRIVRDMSKKLNKEVRLELAGEETEVDKNIIEHLADPLMHLVRNSIDHGIETAEERLNKGKPAAGRLMISAQHAGSEVVITVKDDGKGLNREKILERARANGLLTKPENEMSASEIYSLIFLPGFSTKDSVSEFSGRGVGMDVVVKNISMVGGSVSVDSIVDAGTVITLKIPLTLAIIGGMNIRVGRSMYTIPTASIKESYRAKEENLIIDTDGNEMLMVRGLCYPVLRLHERFKVRTDITSISEGIIVMVESGEGSLCIFVDELVGEQQVVVKTLPAYISKIQGIAGCTLLGDGSISLILDVAGLIGR